MIVLWIVLGLVAAVLLTAALLPARYAITRSTTIARPPGVVFDAIANLNRYREWNPWQKSEPESRQTVTGEPGAIGHAYAWDGKKIGAGSLTLRKTVPGQAIEFDLRFIRPWKSSADDTWRFEPEGENGTRVTWSNTGGLPYPMGRLFGPILSKTLGKQFEEGLASLKQLVEKG